MINKSILMKSIICGSVYLIFSLMLVLVVYIIDIFGITILLGVLYGIVIVVITHCDTIKRTIIAMVMGLLSAVVSQILLNVSGIPYRIIQHIYRNDEFVRETGRLAVNETIGYNWGNMLFWFGLLISFIASFVVILITHKVKKRIK